MPIKEVYDADGNLISREETPDPPDEVGEVKKRVDRIEPVVEQVAAEVGVPMPGEAT